MSGIRDDGNDAVDRIESALDELREIAGLPADGIESFLDDTIGVIVPGRRHDYNTFWEKAKEMPNIFKATRLPAKSREILWAKYQALCEHVKELRNREREARLSNSSQNAEEIRSIIREANGWAASGENAADLQKARSLLGQAMEKMKEKFLLKADRTELWARWKETNDALGARYSELQGINYDRIRSDISDVSSIAVDGDPYEALTRMKEIQ